MEDIAEKYKWCIVTDLLFDFPFQVSPKKKQEKKERKGKIIFNDH